MKYIVFAIIALFTFSSCSESDSTTELLNREWHLEIFEDVAGLPESMYQVPIDEHYVLVFNDTAVTGIADCNTFTGNYTVNGDRISFSNIAATETDCGDLSLEARFLQALRTAKKYSFRHGALRIRYDDGKQLVFKKGPKQQ